MMYNVGDKFLWNTELGGFNGVVEEIEIELVREVNLGSVICGGFKLPHSYDGPYHSLGGILREGEKGLYLPFDYVSFISRISWEND